MGFLVKEYDLPGIGKIKLIESGLRGYEKHFYGKYYSEIVNCSKKLVTGCNSLEELMEKTSNRISILCKERKNILSEQINEKEQEATRLNNLEEEINHSENKTLWLKEYQTDNPLQLELQNKLKLP